MNESAEDNRDRDLEPQEAEDESQITPAAGGESDDGMITGPQNISPGRVILILIILALIFEIMTVISELAAPREIYRYDAGDYFPDTAESYRGAVEYPDDDEVRAAGTACSQLEHFDFMAVSLLDDLHGILKEQNLDVREIDNSSFNEIFEDGGSWYETLVTIYLDVPGDESDYQRLTLNYDTATGALHEIDLFLSDEDHLLDLTDAVLAMLNERTATFTGSSLGDAQKALKRSVSRGENLYATYGSYGTDSYLTVTLYCFEDGYSVYLGRE